MKDKATGIPLENNITDQNNYTFEGLQNQGNNTAGNTDIIPLPQDVEEILGEAEKHPTILGPQVYLHYKKSAAVSKHFLFKFNCFVCSNYKLITGFKECLTSLHNTKLKD